MNFLNLGKDFELEIQSTTFGVKLYQQLLDVVQ